MSSLVERLEDRCLLSAYVAGAVAGGPIGRGQHGPSDALPAVQKVEETAARTQQIADLHNPGDNARLGLLLPAIQKVGEAPAGGSDTVAGPPNQDFVLPAVQKVQEAAARARNGFVLPALQNVQEAAERLWGGGDVTGPPNDDFQPPAGHDDQNPNDGSPNDGDVTGPPNDDFQPPAGHDGQNPNDGSPNDGDVTGPPNDVFQPPAGQNDQNPTNGSPDDGGLAGPTNDEDLELPTTQNDQESADHFQDDTDLISLLNGNFKLAAIQTLRKVADHSDRQGGQGHLIGLPTDDAEQPAVQTEREATARNGNGFEPPDVQEVQQAPGRQKHDGELPGPLNVDSRLPEVQNVQQAAGRSQDDSTGTGTPHEAAATPALQTEGETADRTRSAADLKNSGEHSLIDLLLGSLAGCLTLWAMWTEPDRERDAQYAFPQQQDPRARRRRRSRC